MEFLWVCVFFLFELNEIDISADIFIIFLFNY